MAQNCTPVHPIDPAHKKPSSPLAEKRSLLRTVLTARLRELTNEPRVRMRYNEHDMWQHVVHKHGYRLVGWPESIPFVNLSRLKGGRRPIEELLELWNMGTLTFVRVESLDAVFALKPRTNRKRASRCDLGTHRKARCCHHRGALTPLTVLAEVDARMDAEAEAFKQKHGR
ncbi:hypothetical protein FOMPIDRAFT_87309 [Fomitopsis schrenkii]|uniref:Uncharacterized protein n=1 Tax=Fomitopsis schrenkii TaxID=2126942 RepID=S8DTW1_FOMSC|nr:hypothetical protein FOMPIDRAFT_87309 [Fomitopsis schrenkii]